MHTSDRPVVVGISASLLHGDDERKLYNGRPLLYLEQSMAEWIMATGEAVPLMIPAARPEFDAAIGAADFADAIDGLLLQGGVDMAPESYGEEPLNAEWAGDAERDRYELDLIRQCLESDRPILAICRGQQVLNVALGGTLIQDIETQVDGAIAHIDRRRYHENTHAVRFTDNSKLRSLYGVDRGEVNSVHHQAIQKLGTGLNVEARSPQDGIIEAIRLAGDRYAVGVQWHPEFQEPSQSQLLPTKPLLEDFFAAIRRRAQ